ncbi:MAG: GTP-binding protein, partial [Candidatus Marinimicrobia bacterium]|nr:GTP-binding protein [Candidatus Neomarinimicrobiota bacterium]
MKEYQTEEIRNIVLLGHASSGKTSLAEAMLFTAGATNRLGRIDDGTTISDYHEDEIARKFSITSSLLHYEWKNRKINIVDSPGYLDFISESKAITRVANLALIVVHARTGVEVGTELVFNFAKEDDLPCWFIVNQLDKEHADFDKVMENLKSSFGKKVFPLQLPVNAGVDFNSVIDILSRKLLVYSKDGKGTVIEEEIPADLKSRVDSLHENVIEFAAESGDELLEKFFEEGTLSEEEILNGLKKAIISRNLFPVFTTSAYNNIGVSNLMDAINKYGPSP